MKDMLVDRFEEPLNPERAGRLSAAMEHAKHRLKGLKQQVPSRGIRSVSQLVDVSDGYARSIVNDHDQTIGVVGNIEKEFDA